MEDRYRVLRRVGKGTFGEAFLVMNRDNGAQYIMKRIHTGNMTQSERNEAMNEVRVLSSVRHPNIIRYIDSFENKKGDLCIIMEYASGGDLHDTMRKRRGVHLGEAQLLEWFVQICLGVKHCHDRKILHRDIKTQNVFMTSNGVMKLGDFGISRVLKSTMECAKTLVGTPYYLSPEICQEKPYNNKSDIWALGCVLYEMATNKHAFDARNMRGLVVKILRGIYPPIPSMYSADLRFLIQQMFELDPRKRPSINTILKKPFIRKRMESVLSRSQLVGEGLVDGPRLVKKSSVRVEEKKNEEVPRPKRRVGVEDVREKRRKERMEEQKQQEQRFEELRRQYYEDAKKEAERNKQKLKDGLGFVGEKKEVVKEVVKEVPEVRNQRKKNEEEETVKNLIAAHRQSYMENRAEAENNRRRMYEELGIPIPSGRNQRMSRVEEKEQEPNMKEKARMALQSAEAENVRRAQQVRESHERNMQRVKEQQEQERRMIQVEQERRRTEKEDKQRKRLEEEEEKARKLQEWRRERAERQAEKARVEAQRMEEIHRMMDDIKNVQGRLNVPQRRQSEDHPRSHGGQSEEVHRVIPPRSHGGQSEEVHRVIPPRSHGEDVIERKKRAERREMERKEFLKQVRKDRQAVKVSKEPEVEILLPGGRVHIEEEVKNVEHEEEDVDTFIDKEVNVPEKKEEEEEFEYNDVLDTMRSVMESIDGDSSGSDVESFEEEVYRGEPTVSKFVLHGETLRLPNVTSSDSLASRIETLRLYVEEQIGLDIFFSAYRMMRDLMEGDDDDNLSNKLEEVLGEDQVGVGSLINQLIFCEDRMNDQNFG